MPLFDREINELADYIGRSDLTIYLHTQEPTNADPTIGRLTAGGGDYESGAMLAASDISMASSGDISNTNDVSFGTATGDAGQVTHWSAVRGSDAVGYGEVPSTNIETNDTVVINSGSIAINGSTS